MTDSSLFVDIIVFQTQTPIRRTLTLTGIERHFNKRPSQSNSTLARTNTYHSCLREEYDTPLLLEMAYWKWPAVGTNSNTVVISSVTK